MSSTTNLQDEDYIQLAIRLGRRGLGRVAPNPAVGCVLVRDGHIVGRGWTQAGGRPHAETEAIRRAGPRAQGATAYVSLEPCAHHGQTPPCADALIDAGITRVVYGLTDPDPRVAGQGLARLKTAGIDVVGSMAADAARAANLGFLSKIERQRPWVTLKLATSLDGFIATETGESQWITGDDARAQGHLLRAENDAILIGAGTLVADDPSLTCRLPGRTDASPLRVVLRRNGDGLSGYQVMQTATVVPTLLICTEISGGEDKTLSELGVEIVVLKDTSTAHPEPAMVLQVLADRGISRLLVEGGGQIAAAFLQDQRVDEIYHFRAGVVFGATARPAVGALKFPNISAFPSFERKKILHYGKDCLEILQKPDY